MSERSAARTVVLATRNQGKVREFRRMFEPLGWEVAGLDAFPDVPNVVEDGDTFEANAVKKATAVSSHLGLPALADDSGLEVDALGGAPGVYSARYAGEGASDEDNWRKLLAALKDVPAENRTARFRCVLAYVEPGRPPVLASGHCEGMIVNQPAGEHGFGYDPVFYLPEHGCTMAQLSPEVKNRISHRAMAMRNLLEAIRGM